MVHKFDTLGVKCALDVCSGSVHILDDTAYRMLDFFNEEGVFDEDAAKKENCFDKIHQEANGNQGYDEGNHASHR